VVEDKIPDLLAELFGICLYGAELTSVDLNCDPCDSNALSMVGTLLQICVEFPFKSVNIADDRQKRVRVLSMALEIPI
jgi:hypothetical protein